MVTRARLAVVDDELTFAEAIAAQLAAEEGIEVLGAFGEVGQLWPLVEGRQLDLVVLDAGLDEPEPLGAARRLRHRHPDIRVVLLSDASDPENVVEALQIGIRAWVPKNAGLGQFLAAVRGAVVDETWLPGSLLSEVLETLMRRRETAVQESALLGQLTVREREILQCLVDGSSRAEVARRLYVSPNTVRTHVQNVLHKFGVHSCLTAVAMARRAGMEPTPWCEDAATPEGAPSPSQRPMAEDPPSGGRMQVGVPASPDETGALRW